MEYRYNYLNNFLKEKFGERTLKICIDGNFTCPNRDGKVGSGGCIFCSEKGSGDHLSKISIEEQVKNYLNSERAKRANKYIAYFQNYTNTYNTVEILKSKYDSALIDDRIVALAIATRPDELNDEKIKLIKSYQKKYYVWVELGLQTINNKTIDTINRCYKNEEFEDICQKLNKENIDIVVHIMVGLPGETHDDIENIINYLNKKNIKGIKIHSTYIVKNTILEKMYNNGIYQPISFEDYMYELVYIITHLRKDIIIHRFTGDPPKEIFIAPKWTLHKKWVINGLNKTLEERNLYQGIFYEME